MFEVKINTKTVIKNLKNLRARLNQGVKVCAVLKANAYGLGDVEIAEAVNPLVDFFAVAEAKEAIRLREVVGMNKPILLFGNCNNVDIAIRYNLTVSVQSLADIKSICKKIPRHTKLFIHIKVNTGLNRFGISTLWQLQKIISFANSNSNIIIAGLYTHMTHEDNNPVQVDAQLKKFTPFRLMLKRHFPRALIHVACSGNAHLPRAQFDMVRIGKSMYGGFDGYKTCISITAKISAIQQIQKGSSVGYGSKFTATEPTTVGIVQCGYADLGYMNHNYVTQVLVGKRLCNILGTICMDTFAIDVTEINNPIGKDVTILSPSDGITIMDFVKQSGKSACVLLSSLDFTRADVVYK